MDCGGSRADFRIVQRAARNCRTSTWREASAATPNVCAAMVVGAMVVWFAGATAPVWRAPASSPVSVAASPSGWNFARNAQFCLCDGLIVGVQRKDDYMGLLILIIILVLLFGGGGGYYGYRSGYYGGGGHGLIWLLVLVVILFLLFGHGRYGPI